MRVNWSKHMFDSKRSRHAQLGLGLGQLLGIPTAKRTQENLGYINESYHEVRCTSNIWTQTCLFRDGFFSLFSPDPKANCPTTVTTPSCTRCSNKLTVCSSFLSSLRRSKVLLSKTAPSQSLSSYPLAQT